MVRDDEIRRIKERYSSSRASVMTQIFVTIAGANGVGIAAVLSMISQRQLQDRLVPYLTAIVFLLGFGFIVIVISALLRFQHSRLAERKDLAEIQGKNDHYSDAKRKIFYYGYTGAIYLSVLLLFSAILMGMLGAYGVYSS